MRQQRVPATTLRHREVVTLPSAPHVRRRVSGRLATLLLALSVAEPAAAQSLGVSPPGYAEYLSLLGTPAASLPPLPTATIIGVVQATPQVVARYGYVPDITRPLAPSSGGHASRSLDSFGLTGVLPVGLDATVSLTAGLSNERCTGCSGSHFMASVGSDYRLLRTPLGASADAMRLTVSVDGELGFGRPASGTTWTANVGAPLAISFGPVAATQIVPFITPSFAVLATSSTAPGSSDVRAGRLLLGGGVALFNPKSVLGASVGFQYVFVDRTEMQIGVGLSIGGR